MRMWCGVVLLLSLFGGVLPLGGCAKNPDDQAIRALIELVRLGMEDLDYSVAVDAVSEDYSDNAKNTRKNLEARLKRIFYRFESSEIKINILEIKREGLTALARLKVKIDGIDGERKERLFGNPIRAAELHLHLEKRSGRWRIVGSTVVQKRGIL